MNEAWSQWEGHTVNGEFHLRKYLGGSYQNAVFLTEQRGCEPQQAAIKLIRVDATNLDLQLARWGLAEKLSHPHLIRLLQIGRCQFDADELIFVVMEYAEENLAQILPERRLTAAEAREMLEPVLDALTYLHGQGFVHGGLKPANVMAIQDQLKLASDSACNAGQPFPDPGKRSAYDPPEKAGGVTSPAADIWSLGMTLAEVLTQRLPAWKGPEQTEPMLPEGLSTPFSDIVRGCLRRDPKSRWTITEIATSLDSHASSQTNLLSNQQPGPQPKLQAEPIPGPAPEAPQKPKPGSSSERSTQRRFVVPSIVAVVAVLAILVTLGLLRRQHADHQSTSEAKPEQKMDSNQAGTSEPKTSDQPTSNRSSAPPSRTKPSPASQGSQASAAAAGRGATGNEVVHQVLPDVAQAALDTIQGTVKVNVRVQVDQSGNVIGSKFDSPGPSKYFAQRAMQAAQSWKFGPSAGNDRREFILRFEFRSTGAKAVVTRAAR